jgi:hypothetical protein
VLERLVGADELAELLARLEVVDDRIEAARRRARALRRDEQGAEEPVVAERRATPDR